MKLKPFIFTILLGIFISCIIGYSVKATSFDATSVTVVELPLTKIAYSGSNPVYIGENLNADAADGDTDWTITKITWSGSTATVIQKRTGSWTLRTTYF